ncbi:putative endonuclease or glyc s in 10 species: Archae - 0 [Striga asiatica]|uniref:Putative endonuclease or glyc s in 10 species: Archae-0 n=1 Tax=Striga asiatica TaxID=4170 RepID=A0A5A7RJM3_STRAF|nr:putative endonuclease or glyc s in 10 species: Archae - 0 [Striga asiatica]
MREVRIPNLHPPKTSSSSSSSSTAKRVVQFRPPQIVNPKKGGSGDEDEQHSATLGSLPSALGRRLMLETDTRASIATTGSDSVVGPVKPSEVSHGYSGLNSESAYYDENAADGNFDLAPESGISIGIDAGTNHINTVNDYSSSSGGESSAYYGYYGIGPSDVSGVGMAATEGSYGASD